MTSFTLTKQNIWTKAYADMLNSVRPEDTSIAIALFSGCGLHQEYNRIKLDRTIISPPEIT